MGGVGVEKAIFYKIQHRHFCFQEVDIFISILYIVSLLQERLENHFFWLMADDGRQASGIDIH